VAAVRVLLADDHAEVRADLCVRLGKVFEIIAAVEDGKQAVDATLRLDPDVVVLDISMPVVNGFQAAVYLRGVKCRAKIVFLTTYEDSEYVEAAFSSGADAYVTKQHFITDLVPAIQVCTAGTHDRPDYLPLSHRRKTRRQHGCCEREYTSRDSISFRVTLSAPPLHPRPTPVSTFRKPPLRSTTAQVS
jgi:DNA-binding NarL/FixJ family response regulator